MKTFTPEVLHVRATYKCNVKCRHCHNDSGTEKELALSLAQLQPLIDNAKALGLNRVTLEGGEIFLFPALLKSIIQQVKQHNLKVSIVTNGFWGKSKKAAINAIRYLKEANWIPGKDDLYISAGEFHQEWIPTETVKTAVETYFSEFGQRVAIDFEHNPNNGHLLDEFKSLKFVQICTKMGGKIH
jgi:hypothetical protein